MDSTVPGAIAAAIPQEAITVAVMIALAEDIGARDLTAELLPARQSAKATIISREAAVLCGTPWAKECFHQLDPDIDIHWAAREGESVQPGQTLCEIHGNTRAMLTAERCALNFLQALSATATITRQYVAAIAGTGAQIYDTRKTLPGLRLAQKYAVTVGGGQNQRMGLYDGILIKENHIAAAGSIEAALQAAQDLAAGSEISIQIEVENLSQLEAALDSGARLILLDNFSLQGLRDAVKLARKRAVLEASGGISLDNVRDIALTGVDRISIGSLTKNLMAIDLSMRFTAQP